LKNNRVLKEKSLGIGNQELTNRGFMELDENTNTASVKTMLAEDIERLAGIYQMKHGVSKTSFYRLLVGSSTRLTEERDELFEVWQYLQAALSAVNMSGKQEVLENLFNCITEVNNAIEEITND
jgi:hypothetical protein